MIPNGQMGNLQDLFVTNIMNGGTGSTLHLFKNNLLSSPTVGIGDFVEADFDGYSTDGPHTDWLKVVDPDVHRGSIVLPTETLQTVVGNTNLPQVIYGYYVVGNTGELCCWEHFKVPVQLSEIYQGFTPDVHFVFNESIQDNP